MKRIAICLSVLSLGIANRAVADCPYGATSISHQMTLVPGVAVSEIAGTTRDQSDPCGASVRAEARIYGITDWQVNNASVSASVTASWGNNSGPIYGSFIGQTRHTYFWNTGSGLGTEGLGTYQDEGFAQPPPTPEEQCSANQGEWRDPPGECVLPNCPLLIDVRRGSFS